MLCCPVCRGELLKTLRCAGCGEQFRFEKGIYRLVSPRVSVLDGCWNDDDFAEEYAPGQDIDENGKSYSDYLNEETKQARALWTQKFKERLTGLKGNVMDIATGQGGAMRMLLESKGDFLPIGTDLCGSVMGYARAHLKAKYGITREFAAVNTDVRHLAFKDGVIDTAITLAGLQEIKGTLEASREIRRVMKPGGKLLALAAYFDAGSPSAKRAEGFGGLRGVIKELLMGDLAAADFKDIRVETVSQAVLAPNPRDRTPVAGDTMYYGILEAGV